MSQVPHIAQRVAAFLQKRNAAAYCESCLVERLLIASRAAMKAALETDRFTIAHRHLSRLQDAQAGNRLPRGAGKQSRLAAFRRSRRSHHRTATVFP